MGLRPVLVHGGGPEINLWLKRLNIEVNFWALARDQPIAQSESLQVKAIGLCGTDGQVAQALGFVGEVVWVDPIILWSIVNDGHIPVIASVAARELLHIWGWMNGTVVALVSSGVFSGGGWWWVVVVDGR
ncbi:hypothetical protein G4B88_014942 [Cannabis sativa]|uniref:Acetylglutamate kinase n=1 Tax=Cannabis sativa TaxID=3483 RepID=A0A7J6F3T6_CANSA|nr:hypothetical protein G4B88_014942 [Cannabis sativa]